VVLQVLLLETVKRKNKEQADTNKMIYKNIASVLLISTVFLCAKDNSLVSQIPEVKPGILQGYLDSKMLPNSLNLIPTAPIQGSASQKYDNAVAKLHSDPQFLSDLGMAKKELASLYAKGIKSPNDCKFESDALSVTEAK